MTFVTKFVFAALLLLSFHQSSVCAQERDQAIKIEATLVSVPVTVSDRSGRYYSGLKATDFTLYRDGVKQPIAFFSTEEEALHVAILLDTSRSTQAVLDDIKEHAQKFLKQLRPQDRAMVVCFDYDVHVLSPLTADRKALERAIKKAKIGDYVGTTLRDAVAEVTTNHFQKISGRKAIILLTDGKDHGSRLSVDELLDAAAESDTMIYSVFYTTSFMNRQLAGQGFPRRQDRPRQEAPSDNDRRRRRWPQGDRPGQFPDRRPGRERRNLMNERAVTFLETLSEVSAGRFFASELTDLEKTFASIADELRHQYRLGFYPEGERQTGVTHRLRVEVARPDAVVRARRSYSE